MTWSLKTGRYVVADAESYRRVEKGVLSCDSKNITGTKSYILA